MSAWQLKEVSVDELFTSGKKCTYEIPIYQRNYAWEKDEIVTLVQDVYDSFMKRQKENQQDKIYYIGTLVTYYKGDDVFEVIDGQQRLTTIFLILKALSIVLQDDTDSLMTNKLHYRARQKSMATLEAIPDFKLPEKDDGIENGFKYAKEAISDIPDIDAFARYFRQSVHIIHYNVPKDIDLNTYFEVMNSRGEQLEKHEIVKARLMSQLNDNKERKIFNYIWERCAEMSNYVQHQFAAKFAKNIFGENLDEFKIECFDGIDIDCGEEVSDNKSIEEILQSNTLEKNDKYDKRADAFQPIIDFPNFLLIVLKINRIREGNFSPDDFYLDDKELINEFDKIKNDSDVKQFIFYLLKARFLLDNYIVHHIKDSEKYGSNPWKLQRWHKEGENYYPKNLCGDYDDKNTLQARLVQLLSMFEVSFSSRQRKNYLVYSLMYLMDNLQKDGSIDVNEYADFVENMAERYFFEVYLNETVVNSTNTPIANSFDKAMLEEKKVKICEISKEVKENAGEKFVDRYGDCSKGSKGIPLFVFNYMDYKLWRLYDEENKSSELLGCEVDDKVFKSFYFSRSRRSLEHYYPQAMATGKSGYLNQEQINCFGNYAMIGSRANSSGSNWSPETKLNHYLDASMKIDPIGVASLKFRIMLQICRDKKKWELEEIKQHQEKMLAILMR